jgi:dTDP-4-dehydrorhamnose reductase
MKVLTLGNGFIANHLPYGKITERLRCDLHAISQMLNFYKPDVLINCIGKTGSPNIDWCEKNKAETYLGNVTLPTLLAAECEKFGIHFIHIGSGCIFFGESPNIYSHQTKKSLNPVIGAEDEEWVKIDKGWKEIDFANPQSFYSKTKYATDLTIGSNQFTTILRIRMPISSKNDPRNFINKIRGYKQVIDEPNSVTFVDDLVKCVDWCITNKTFGIYHVTNPQPLSAADTMREYQKYHPDHKFDVITTNELDKITIAKRSNCTLSTEKLYEAGFIMTPSKEALERCMAEYVKNIGD